MNMDKLYDLVDEMKKLDLKKHARSTVKDARIHIPRVRLQRDVFEVSDFMIGVAVGSFVGFLAALLFAPKSGEETRALIGDKTRAVGEMAKDTIETAVDKTGRLAAEGRERVESTLHKGQKQYDVAKSQGRDFAYETREHVSDALDKASDEVDPKPRI